MESSSSSTHERTITTTETPFPHSQETTVKPNRVPCTRCERPIVVCICAGLPPTPLKLARSRVIVLQHPHELRRKNRSLPIVRYCLSDDDYGMTVVVGRKLGDKVDPLVLDWIQDDLSVLLVFPSKDAVSLEEGLDILKKRRQDVALLTSDNSILEKKVNLLFIDASWKHAKEMVDVNDSRRKWPQNLIKVRLTFTSTGEEQREKIVPRRFSIRSLPVASCKDDESMYLSTAECIAWVLTFIEKDERFFEIIVKAIDTMVMRWMSMRRTTTH